MSAKNDQFIGLTATVPASRDQVVAVARHAAGVLGNKVDVEETSAKVSLLFYPGLARAISRRSPSCSLKLKPAGDDKVTLQASMDRWITTQSRFMFIPIGPKMISGKSQWVSYLRALEQELRALGSTVEHTGNW